jgi:DNA-binding winged helix-turn-helix (wHTH) protein
LLHEEQPVECGSRAFDLLHVLLLSRGKVVSKDDIVRHVWPTTCVEESNLRFQMASLRKVLGTYRDLIKTIPGRGYLLASDFVERAEPAG